MNNSAESRNIKVLMYHRIVENEQEGIGDINAVRKEDFRLQLQMLERFNFTPITFEDYQLYLEDKLTLPKKPIILTFDDGYRDTYEVALPLLQRFDMQGVIYVLGDRDISYAYWNEKEGKQPLMTDQQVKEVRSEGFEIGAHTLTHPRLNDLSKDEIEEEIIGSKISIENLLGEKIISFSYPYGILEEHSHSIAASSSFKFACGVFSGPPRFGEDWFNIHRLAVNQNTSLAQFLAKVLLPYEYAIWFYHQLKKKKNDRPQSLYKFMQFVFPGWITKEHSNLHNSKKQSF